MEASADALLVIPKTLAVHAELLGKLKAIYANSKSLNNIDEPVAIKNYRLDLVEGEIRDNLAAGVVEPAISKIESLQFFNPN
jgi:T-complex protein 1 subunit alpha